MLVDNAYDLWIFKPSKSSLHLPNLLKLPSPGHKLPDIQVQQYPLGTHQSYCSPTNSLL